MKIPHSLRWKATGSTLGRGGQGTVQVVIAQSGVLTKQYALKALTSGKQAKAYERFAREIAAIKLVSLPAIVEIVDHSQPADDFQFYVM